MRSSTYVVLDLETTGLSAIRHGVTELFAARVSGKGDVLERFHTMVNPGQRIPSFITHLTGITNQMVLDAPPIHRVIGDFEGFVKKKDVLVGHNLRFDMSFLDHHHWKSEEQPLANERLCTLLLSRRVLARSPLHSYRLGTVAEHFGVRTELSHRAQADVMMTIAIKQKLFEMLSPTPIHTLGEVLELQHLPLSRALKILEGSITSRP